MKKLSDTQSKKNEFTPMMQRYLNTKEEYKDCLLLYRLGDFYELFFEDAKIASKTLDIALTGRSCGKDEKAPMCGVPYHAVDSYVAKLLEKGYKVAICEQMSEEPENGESVINREVTRVITSGTIIESEILEDKISNYILCVYKKNDNFGISFCDVSTGEFKITEFKNDKTFQKGCDLLSRIKPAEILCNDEMQAFCLGDKNIKNLDFLPPFFKLPDLSFSEKNCIDVLKKQFNIDQVKGHDFVNLAFACVSAGALIEYLLSTQKRSLNHINKIMCENDADYMVLDYNACKNLELIENAKDKKKKGSLLGFLNKTKTSMGLRLLQKWILQPLQNVNEINSRLDCVEELFYNNILLNDLGAVLDNINDIERICSKISYGTVMPKDCVGLKNSLLSVVDLSCLIKELSNEKFKEFFSTIESIKNLANLLEKAFVEDAPNIISNGGFIKEDFNEELSSLKNTSIRGTKWLKDLEDREKEETGIKSLKVGYSRIIGYYIEVNKSQMESVPYRYIRKQTISNHERFVTDELKEIENKILNAQELSIKLEISIFNKIKEQLKSLVDIIQQTAREVAFIDVISSFAFISLENKYVRPMISNKIKHIKIKDGRHPIVEANLKSETFVPNDTYIDEKDDRTLIITGPNMAGKSTYMRQVALICIMAHIGCFVPAKLAEIPIIDRIFTRIGASDDLNSGQSTFMVEMVEVANILNNATNKSLVLLDEVGRGTATYDGMSIAWSILEYISQKIKSKTLFSTHYHELTSLEGKMEGIKNYRVGVKEFNNSIIFLRKVLRGSADRSFGIEVASMSGIYEEIIIRAKSILNSLEKNSIKLDINKIDNNGVISQVEKDNIINQIKNIDVNSISPMDAFEILLELTKKVNKN